MLAECPPPVPTWVLYLGPLSWLWSQIIQKGKQAGRLVTILLFLEALDIILNPLCSVHGTALLVSPIKSSESLDSFISLTPHIQPINRSCLFSFCLFLESDHMPPPPSLPSCSMPPWSLALNDCSCLLVRFPASALTHRQSILYTEARIIFLKC